MISIFDLEKLRGLLKDFYAMSSIRITVFDENLTELVSYPKNVSPYCALIRGTAKGREACRTCDRNACLTAAKRHGPHIYRCHAGLTEAVTPLYVGDVLVGYLLFGHVFSYSSHEAGWPVIRDRCQSYGVDEERLKEAVFAADIIEKSYIRSATRILHAVASYLIMEHMATLKEDLVAVRLDSYLNAHYTEKLNAKIRALRMEKAKELLSENKDLPLAEVADRCGFTDYNYFITVFSREVGISPAAFRKH